MRKALTPFLKGQRVIVVGGGRAGLVAGRDLGARGADVQLLEARARLGGRVCSIDDADFSDAPIELGGEFIDGEHAAIRSLCRDLKLTLVPVLKDGFGLSWELDPYALGGYTFFPPDFRPEWRSELSRSFGRIAFAGDHTSRYWHGYMNGAVESGHRAARDIEMMKLMELPSAPA